jgi:hypothetical protein
MGKVHVFKNYIFNKTKTLSFTLQKYRQMNPVDMIYLQHLITSFSKYKVRATKAVLGLNK